MKQCETYEEAVRCLLDTPKFTTKNLPEATDAFYEFLGRPGEDLHIIHTAGTNGKGSVCAFLERILSKAGYRTALFTSPHLIDIRERMRIGFAMISKEDFLFGYRKLCEKVSEYQKDHTYEPTYFEILFFMGMDWFQKENVDFVVLETGLGGRLDATNVVRTPEMTVITSVGLDHMEYLGDTVSKIAAEKAGIAKKNVPLVSLLQGAEVDEVLKAAGKRVGAPVYLVPKEAAYNVSYGENGIDFSLCYAYYNYTGLCVSTTASYQVENATLAVVAASFLAEKYSIPREAIYEGIREMNWEGRMENIRPNLFIDGAHNIPGVRAFLDSVSHDGQENRALVFAAVKDKAYADMIGDIAESGLFTSYCITEIPGSRTLGCEKMREEFRKKGCRDVTVRENPKDAYDWALSLAQSGRRTYIAGSLYLVGMMKEFVNYD